MRTSIPRYLRHACIVLPVAFFSGQALADDNDSGPYLGGGYGQFNTKIKNVEGVTNVIGDLDTSEWGAWKLFAGWRFMKYLSLEADYIDLGNPRANFDASGSNGDYRVEMSGFGAYVIGTLPITIFELSAKAGYYWHDVKVDVNFNNIGESQNVLHTNDNGSAFVYGVGAGVTLIDHLNFNLEYERMEIDKLNDTYNLWVTAAWRF